MAFTYILFSGKLNKYYIGATADIQRRFDEHNKGQTKFTSLGIPWNIVFLKEFQTLNEAKQYERFIKKQKSRKFIQQLINNI